MFRLSLLSGAILVSFILYSVSIFGQVANASDHYCPFNGLTSVAWNQSPNNEITCYANGTPAPIAVYYNMVPDLNTGWTTGSSPSNCLFGGTNSCGFYSAPGGGGVMPSPKTNP